ncbi:hypothetical protein SEEE4220_03683 [Salmonella enterica subsp. enterica serovar Enteritidis str. 543463 42-20]|uniref:hypothetical protein n=1 Tax=Salmonella enterica TaxID=28901 RepID=UPI0002A6AB2C|nr:hypothetical protein [Salmonella enterica]ELO69829.1 hypothetical protein SEEE4220_03683 [Salmonella enterica subsp. enterica serovar Enteritidis str. 543463 42-20]
MATIKYGDAGTVTGKAFLKQQLETTATALPLPIVSKADLSSALAPINQACMSGKQKGAMVIMEDDDTQKLHIAVAAGPLPTDAWKICNLDGEVSPAQGL